MTWPASDVGTGNIDAGTDSPATARADLQDLVTKFNQLRNHVTALMQTVIGNAPYTPAISQAYGGTTVTIDASQSNVFEISALNGNVNTLTINNPGGALHSGPGRTLMIRFVQDGTGSRTVAHPAGSQIQGSINPAANKVSWLSLVYANNGGSPRWEGSWMLLP